MNRGFVKLWRKSLDSGWIRNHKLWAFWTWCIMKATHQDFKQVIGCQEVLLVPGQFIFGRKKASEELNISEQEIRTILGFLKKTGSLTIKSTNKYSVISIINWPTYNGYVKDNQPPVQPAINHQITTNKNINNINNNFLNKYRKSCHRGDSGTDTPYAEIIEYLNQKSGKKFDHRTKETRAKIKARWNGDGVKRTIEDFKRVIDNKCAKWLPDPKMQDYLRPETLFGTKFESYLNEKSSCTTPGDGRVHCPKCKELVFPDDLMGAGCRECLL